MRAPAALLALATACSSGSSSHAQVRIAAAANTEKAFTEVGKAYLARTGVEPIFTFGSSGLLAKQIEQGAPFFAFASANKQFADAAIASSRCDKTTLLPFARGKLVVWVAKGRAAPASLAELADPTWGKLAIANPEHAPFGKAAQQALAKLDLWDKVKDKVVLGENVEATLQFAQTGNVDAAIIAQSLAVVTDGGSTLAIEQSLHDPLDQYLVVCGAGAEAQAARGFAAFVASPDGREILTRYGFAPPQ